MSRWQCWCKWTTINKQTPLEREEKCDVTLPWWQNHDLDLNNLSWQGRPFACSNDGKVWATVLFLSAIMHKKGIHVNFFVLFVAWTTVCSDFATMATRHSDFSSSVFFWFAPLRMNWRGIFQTAIFRPCFHAISIYRTRPSTWKYRDLSLVADKVPLLLLSKLTSVIVSLIIYA